MDDSRFSYNDNFSPAWDPSHECLVMSSIMNTIIRSLAKLKLILKTASFIDCVLEK